jgi:hypothetical protein
MEQSGRKRNHSLSRLRRYGFVSDEYHRLTPVAICYRGFAAEEQPQARDCGYPPSALDLSPLGLKTDTTSRLRLLNHFGVLHRGVLLVPRIDAGRAAP